ncbi:hypothetical protein [Rhodococcus sp. IEGM 1408]|uniref:hypothetical protein n=1 Tax=Rhodococcus sp. IEGM 1408 TaxID=3082220 RepID=UPI002955DCB4|nr:hypothetical protein [Rhodococcus sp. IEGM 1408]MDV8001970.1 hypothetical protein [Rhodococcus sp. IEGM 1408]
MADGTIRADAGRIASAVSVFGGAGERAAEIAFPNVVAGLETALPGGSAITSALDRACGAAAVHAARCSGRMTGLADFAAEAHRFLEASDEDFAGLLARVVPG